MGFAPVADDNRCPSEVIAHQPRPALLTSPAVDSARSSDLPVPGFREAAISSVGMSHEMRARRVRRQSRTSRPGLPAIVPFGSIRIG